MKKAFTLVELVMVIVIIGILAAVAIPRFVDLSSQAKDGATKGALGGLRSGIAIFYASQAAAGSARWPTSAAEIRDIMNGVTPPNALAASSVATVISIVAGTGGVPGAANTDNNGWVYARSQGRIFASNDTSW